MTLNFLGTTSAYQSKYGSVELKKQIKNNSTKDEVKLRRKHKNIQKAKTVVGDVLKLAGIGVASIYAAKNPQNVGKLIGSAVKFAKASVSYVFASAKSFITKIPSFISTIIKNAK